MRDGVKRHGKGKFVWNARRGAMYKSYYEGDWLDDEMKGRGKRQCGNGDIYVGQFRAN